MKEYDTKVNNNELMWSHYANGHTGVAIGISIDRTKYDIVSVKSVKKLEEQGKLKIDNLDTLINEYSKGE